MTPAGDPRSPSADGGRLFEAAAVAVVGGVLGAAVTAPLGLSLPAGAVAAANGAVSGWRRIYDWRRPDGVIGFALDSTWALPMTAAGLVANAIATASRRGGYVADLSERQGRHVFAGGFVVRRGFVMTWGNVIAGAGDTTVARRRRLITDHEGVHVWQARWFGPLYPLLYGGWMVAGGAAGAVVWATCRRGLPVAKVVESCAYYLNPFEWWAYSRDDHWPPSGAIPGLAWRRPIVRPLSSSRLASRG